MLTKQTPNNFAAFILTNGRPDSVYTYKSLRNCGYTGRIFLLVDNLDSKKDEYVEKFGKEVIIFDKKKIAKTFDQADNFNDMRAIIYARNASFEVAKKIRVKYFIQLDDDYTYFAYRFNNYLNYRPSCIRNLDKVFSALLKFYKKIPAYSLALAQGGDFIGGEESDNAQKIILKRKCMNSFICSTDRPFKFIGRVNEDVNTYTHLASKGPLFFTTNQVCIQQRQTQTSAGGMTEMYLDSGTYVKSFYSVIFQPSSVKISILNSKNSRLHHRVSWPNTVPKILRETWRK